MSTWRYWKHFGKYRIDRDDPETSGSHSRSFNARAVIGSRHPVE